MRWGDGMGNVLENNPADDFTGDSPELYLYHGFLFLFFGQCPGGIHPQSGVQKHTVWNRCGNGMSLFPVYISIVCGRFCDHAKEGCQCRGKRISFSEMAM